MKETVRLLAFFLLAGTSSGCFLLVVGGAGAEGGYLAAQKKRTAAETASDQWIHAKVTASLVAHSKVKARSIDVDVFKGVVTLTGTVQSGEERDVAVGLAKSVKGAARVVDKLAVAK